MKREIIGIIVEFNPMHNGHKRLIDLVRQENKNAVIIVAMSGNFVQRGELAIYDKWLRAETALDYGVDLVIEIPPYFVLNHANIFANQSVKLLNKFGTHKIYFGTENLTIPKIHEIANDILENKDVLYKLKKKYHSLPKAFAEFVNSDLKSNDTLGISYILEAKKMNLDIDFKRIQRLNNDEYLSASKIREKIKLNRKSNNSLIQHKNKTLNIENYYKFIVGKLVTTNSDENIIKYLKNIIADNGVPESFEDLINLAKNNSYTKARLKRDLIRFILEFEKNEIYIILGTNEKGKQILKENSNYEFRHTQNNIDNLKVESFISLIDDFNLKERLSKQTIKK